MKRTQEGLVCPATTSDNADHATGGAADDLLGARRELDAGLALIGVVADNGDVVAGGAAESTTVTDLLLDVGDDGTLGDGAQGEDVADGQGGLLAGVDELAGVHALVGDESLGRLLELVGRVEDHAGEGRTTAGVVDDVLHNTAEVAMALGVVERPELRGVLPQTGVGSENAASALTLIADLDAKKEQSAPSPSPIIPPRETRLNRSIVAIEGSVSIRFEEFGNCGNEVYLRRDPSCPSYLRMWKCGTVVVDGG